MKPLKTLCLIELDEKSNTTPSGIIVTKAWEDARNTGVIKAVSDKVTEVKAGDHVLINPYSVIEFSGDSKNTVFVREEDILALV